MGVESKGPLILKFLGKAMLNKTAMLNDFMFND